MHSNLNKNNKKMDNNNTNNRRNAPTDIGDILKDSKGEPIFTICPSGIKKCLTVAGAFQQAGMEENENDGDPSLVGYKYFWDCDCPQCEARREAEKRAEQAAAERARRKALQEKLKSCGIPATLIDAHIEDWNNDRLGEDVVQRIRNAARRYVSKVYCYNNGRTATNPGNLLICGKSGRGKTPLVQLMAVELMRGEGGEGRVHVTYVDYMSLLTELTDAKNYKGKTLHEIVSYYATRAVLIIDDFGDEEPASWQVGRLFEILDQRKREALPTIVTTGYTDSEALTDQLTEKGYGGAQKGAGMAIKLLRRISTGGNLLMLSKV